MWRQDGARVSETPKYGQCRQCERALPMSELLEVELRTYPNQPDFGAFVCAKRVGCETIWLKLQMRR